MPTRGGICFSGLNLYFSASEDLCEHPFGNKDFLRDLLSHWLSLLICRARINSLRSSSVSLIHKTKTIPLLSAFQVYGNKPGMISKAQAFGGLKWYDRRVGYFINFNSLHEAFAVCQSALQSAWYVLIHCTPTAALEVLFSFSIRGDKTVQHAKGQNGDSNPGSQIPEFNH